MSLQNYLSAVNQYAISQHCEFLITVFLVDNNLKKTSSSLLSRLKMMSLRNLSVILNGVWSLARGLKVVPQLYSSTHLSAAIIICGNPGYPTWSGGKMVTTIKRMTLE